MLFLFESIHAIAFFAVIIFALDFIYSKISSFIFTPRKDKFHRRVPYYCRGDMFVGERFTGIESQARKMIGLLEHQLRFSFDILYFEEDVNAYVKKIGENNFSISVPMGSMRKLTNEEILMDIAHEIGHAVLGHLPMNVIGKSKVSWLNRMYHLHLGRIKEYQADIFGARIV